MGTVGGVKAQRIHTYVIDGLYFLPQNSLSALKLENLEKMKQTELLFLS